MAEWNWAKIATILLILIVLVIVVSGYSEQIKKVGKELLGIGDEVIDYTKLNENAYSGFDEVVRNVAYCRDNRERKCGCKVELTWFSAVHVLNISKDEVKMHYIKERSNLLMGNSWKLDDKKRERMRFLNCYISNGRVNRVERLHIGFDGKGGYIIKEGLLNSAWTLFSDESGKIRFDDKLQLYKDDKDNVCWIMMDAGFDIRECGKK